jgi:hypothetical protein
LGGGDNKRQSGGQKTSENRHFHVVNLSKAAKNGLAQLLLYGNQQHATHNPNPKEQQK